MKPVAVLVLGALLLYLGITGKVEKTWKLITGKG